ncbi:MAG: hypothetical protein ACSHW0_11760 [Thalassotalea sp.]
MSNQSPFILLIKHAFKANLVPAIFLQFIAVFIGVSYFYWPSALPVFQAIGELKSQYSVSFSVYSTAIFGGAIPYCYLLLAGKITNKPFQQALFYCVFWAFLGFIVDGFYAYQTQWFGAENNFATIATKTFVDQFLWSAFITCPFITLAYLWKDCDFNWVLFKKQVNKEFFTLRIPSLVITNWLVWIPCVSLIYAMPRSLQLPLFNVVLCFFVLVLAVLTGEEKTPEA